jgi:serine protease Do
VVLAVNGTAIKDARELSRRVSMINPGTVVKLTIMREGKERTVDITLTKLPEDRLASRDRDRDDDRDRDRNRDRDRDRDRDRGDRARDIPGLGLTIAPARTVAGAGTLGVVITDVDPRGPAADRGLRSGDVILEVAGKAVKTPFEVTDAIEAARKDGKSVLLMRVKSEQGTRFVTVPVGRG